MPSAPVQLMRLQEPEVRGTRGFALWALGFRPFYLLAATFAAFAVPLWALQFAGVPAVPYFRSALWHAHEMVFGFAMAVVVGFLFTAGRNWSQQPTPTGGHLAALCGLWLAARLLALTPWLAAGALVNAAFGLGATVALARALVRARNRRNYFFVALLGVMTLASLAVHAAEWMQWGWPGWAALQVGLDVLLFMLCVMAGRVVPMFTNNGVPGAGAARHPWIERLALGGVLALMLADVLQLHQAWIYGLLAAVALVAHTVRLLLWRPWRVRRNPLVWVLHLGYAWIPLHFALRALAAMGVAAPSLATHALTAGALGTIVIGMMTRTSRGHTARPLRADAFDVASYLLVTCGAAVRVLVPLWVPEWTVPATLASAFAWAAGFALFAAHYAPFLARARLDGQPG
jgi:uncharacterized protein involved in response to NO